MCSQVSKGEGKVGESICERGGACGIRIEITNHAQTLRVLSQLPVQSAIPSVLTPKQLTLFS